MKEKEPLNFYSLRKKSAYARDFSDKYFSELMSNNAH